MKFQYNVLPTKDFIFKPSQLEIYVVGKEFVDGNEVVNIDTVLTETLPTGVIRETKRHQFPVAILSAITGFNTATLQPEINTQALQQLLVPFNLQLK